MKTVSSKNKWRNYYARKQNKLIKTQISDLKIFDIISLDIDGPFTEQPHLILDIKKSTSVFGPVENELEFTFELPSGERYESCGFNKNQFIYKI